MFQDIPFRARESVRFETHIVLVLSLPEAVAYRLRTVDKARAEAHWPAGCPFSVRRSLGNGRMWSNLGHVLLAV